MYKWQVLVLGLVTLIFQLSVAEVIFYKPNTKIAEVDCQNSILILKNIYRTQMKIRQPVDENYALFCQRLSRFAENSQEEMLTGGTGKAVTLLTVESKSFGDSIVDQEVVGVVDVDHIISAMSVVDHDLVQTRLCGILNTGNRSQPNICLYKSRAGLYFIEATSVQTGRFAKTSIVSSTNDSIVLESKDSKGKMDMTFSGTWSSDKKSIDAKISFGNGESSVKLNSGN